MRKLTLAIAAAIALASAGCTADATVIEIGEEVFVERISEIRLDAEAFRGMTVRYEGIFRTLRAPQQFGSNHIVTRLTEGCCGEVQIGLGVILPDDMRPIRNGAWVEVTGALDVVDGRPVVIVSSISETAEHGERLVR